MTRKTFLFATLFLIVFSSCKKDNTTEHFTTYDSYLPLQVGNYWVYEKALVDTNGTEQPLGLDSIWVEKDTTIRNNKYHILMVEESTPMAKDRTILRDSLHYIVNHLGKVVFSYLNFDNAFDTSFITSAQDTIGVVETKMTDKDLAVQVPAGIFVTSAFNRTITLTPQFATVWTTRNEPTRYAKDVGIVYQIPYSYVHLPGHIERRLLRYHLQE